MIVVLAVFAAMIGALVAIMTLAPQRPTLDSGLLLSSPRAIAPFTLLSDTGQPFTNADLKGHWSLLFAGFTHCPDVCPTTLSLLKTLHSDLESKGIAPQVIFLSVDPERDSPDQLARYVDFFDPSFVGITGPNAELDKLTGSLALVYQKVPGETPESYTMDHSSSLVLIDPEGDAVAYFTPPHRLAALSSDIAKVIGA